jgi:hypothetical protein
MAEPEESTMTIPTVTEITRREPLAHDTFIDDLRGQSPAKAITSPATSGSSRSRLA